MPENTSCTIPQVVVYSFGYLHDTDVLDGRPQFVVDVRRMFRDPHHDPAFRELTGRNSAVRDRVLRQPGARPFVASLAATIAAVTPPNPGSLDDAVQVAIGCQGGRHRSVALAEAFALHLITFGIVVEVRHQHIDRPVVRR